MAIAFLSHSSKNKAIVEELFRRLGPDNCVFDKYTFEAGTKTLNQIFDNLGRTDLFVLILSGAALESEWVKLEISQSKDLLDLNRIKRFLPINIDKNISYNDPRIPNWIKQNYDLKHLSNVNIIQNKIKRQLREIIIESNPKIAERTQNFVGRNALIEEFESKYINIDNMKPTAIVVSGIDGVGRRTFLKKALEKNKLFSKSYEPVLISLEPTDGIDDLIIKLDEGYSQHKKDFIHNLLSIGINEKINMIKASMLEYLSSHEVLFFIDDGCLINKTGDFNDWFIQLLNSREFENKVSYCIISRFRPSRSEFFKITCRNISVHIPPLSDSDKEKLFIKVMNSRNISFDEKKLHSILSFLNGFPDQIFYTADLIQDNGIDNVLKMRDYIHDYYDNNLLRQFENIIRDPSKRDLVITLARFGTISYEYIKEIFYDRNDLDESLENMFALGAYELVGAGKEFLKIDYSLSDYIKRNRLELLPEIEQRIKIKLSNIINDNSDIPTYSDVLNTIKQGIIGGEQIPDNLLLPSLVLKSISVLYDKRDYIGLVNLANRVIENSMHIDKQIQREIHYFLCLAYARLKDERFESEIKFFNFPETEFLFGMYHRIRKNYYKAKDHLKQAVLHMPSKIQARSELVLTLFALDQYNEAEALAFENYSKYKNNPYYIQAYFKCLAHRVTIGIDEQKLMNELIEKMSLNPHPRADDMKLVMDAQYDYYVRKDKIAAEQKLKRSMNGVNANTKNAYNILREIYKRENDHIGLKDLATLFRDIAEDEYDN